MAETLSLVSPSNGSSKVCQFKVPGPTTQIHSHDMLNHVLLRTSGAMVPSGHVVWLRIEEWQMQWQLVIFFWLSINHASNFPIIPSFPHSTMRYSSQDGSVYDVDVGGFCGQFLPYLCKSKKILSRLLLTIYFDLHLQNDK